MNQSLPFEFRTICRRLAVNAVLAVASLTVFGVCDRADAQDSVADPAWLTAAPPAPDAVDEADPPALWARHVVALNPPPESGCVLNIAADGVTSVYFNGQRLLKNERLVFSDLSGHAVSFDVTALLRSGNNGIAVSVVPAEENTPAKAAVWLTAPNDRTLTVTGKDWKVSDQAPPVGWQQTDFNDNPNTRGLASEWHAAVPDNQLRVSGIAADRIRVRHWQRQSADRRLSSRPFQFQDGDHVVLLGATFIERAQSFGHLEAVLTAAAGDRHVTFRNLGWSADTVFSESRGIFDSPEQGYLRMIEHVRAEEPSLIVLCYGQNEAMQWGAGPDAQARFVAQFERLIEDLSTTGAGFVIVSPHAFLPAAEPLPDPRHWNDALRTCAGWLKEIASRRDAKFVDLITDMQASLLRIDAELLPGRATPAISVDDHPELIAGRVSQWTDNGMHFNEAGYERMAVLLAERLFETPPPAAGIAVHPADTNVETTSGQLQDIGWQPADDSTVLVQFQFRRTQLSPWPTVVRLPAVGSDAIVSETIDATFDDQTQSLELVEVSVPQPTASQSRTVTYFGADPQYQALRSLIVKKNELYFHRWRPENVTYLFGFRKHEQGNNASEIARFDPLIDALEQQIFQVQQPQWQTFTVRSARKP
ncbi:MAG: GDSL-type esterase/lipase family protein [Planctomycetaceae bacterium]